MALQNIQVVTWAPLEPITASKLNQMVDNDRLLQQNMITGLYSANSVKRDTGVRIMSGLTPVTVKKAQSSIARAYFSGAFSAGCKPIVTTGVFSKNQRDVTITLSALGTAAVLPDHRGFEIHARLLKKATCSFWVSWTAVGY